MSALKAAWIVELRREILGDILGKIEVLETELENLSRRLDCRCKQNALAATLAYERLEARVSAIERELST